jgi:hypothetical protein
VFVKVPVVTEAVNIQQSHMRFCALVPHAPRHVLSPAVLSQQLNCTDGHLQIVHSDVEIGVTCSMHETMKMQTQKEPRGIHSGTRESQ